MPPSALVIANPIAGGGRGAAAAQRLAEALDRRGVPATLKHTAARGDATRLAAECGGAHDAVLAVGGDGTLNEVLNGLDDPGQPLGVLPMGTANVLALALDLPRDPDGLAELTVRGSTRTLDLGTQVRDGEPARRFLLFASAGLDAAVVQRVEQRRGGGTQGKLKWLPPLAATFWNWPRPNLRVHTDTGLDLRHQTQVLFTQLAPYGGVLRLPVPAGAGFHLLSSDHRSRAAWVPLLLRGLRGRLRPGRDLLCRPCREVRVEPEPGAAGGGEAVQVDGDLCGTVPCSWSVRSGLLRVLAPI